MISTDVLDPNDSAEYGAVDFNRDDSDEEDKSCSGDAGVSTGVWLQQKQKRCWRRRCL